jgi:hypothetical protein
VELRPTIEEDAVRAAAQHMILGSEDPRQQLPAARAPDDDGELATASRRIFDGRNEVQWAVARWLDPQ